MGPNRRAARHPARAAGKGGSSRGSRRAHLRLLRPGHDSQSSVPAGKTARLLSLQPKCLGQKQWGETGHCACCGGGDSRHRIVSGPIVRSGEAAISDARPRTFWNEPHARGAQGAGCQPPPRRPQPGSAAERAAWPHHPHRSVARAAESRHQSGGTGGTARLGHGRTVPFTNGQLSA